MLRTRLNKCPQCDSTETVVGGNTWHMSDMGPINKFRCVKCECTWEVERVVEYPNR